MGSVLHGHRCTIGAIEDRVLLRLSQGPKRLSEVDVVLRCQAF
jgi:hypothetical protein